MTRLFIFFKLKNLFLKQFYLLLLNMSVTGQLHILIVKLNRIRFQF